MLSVVGGLWVISGSVPLAAQTTPSASRSFEPATVVPDGTVTVTIAAADYGGLGSVTETLPAGFTYVSDSQVGAFDAAVDGQEVTFTLLGPNLSFSYMVTASSTEDSYSFSGTLVDDDRLVHTVGGDSDITVSVEQPNPGPPPAANNLQFDIVPSKAVKGARVSGVGSPIGSDKVLAWVIETDMTLSDFDGAVGDFEVKETPKGSGTFGLFVSESGATPTGGSQSISVDLPYTNADGVEFTTTLMGDINSRAGLSITPPGPFTISQNIAPGTLIGAFVVNGGIVREYLDGILTGESSDKFSVNDADMTIVYRGGGLEVGTYDLELTVSGDAGLANRTDKVAVQVTATASNMAPTVPAEFTETIKENETGAGLVKAGTKVGDASANVDANDGDALTYSLMGDMASVFVIDADGMISVGPAGISDSGDGGTAVNGDFEYKFRVMVSDGISANNQDISATVTVDANSPVELVGDAADGTIAISREVTAGDVPQELVNLVDQVDDADEDGLTFAVSGNPPHIVHDKDEDGNDVLRLTYIPSGANPGPRMDTITVAVSDSFNDDPDQTLTITVSVTQQEPPPITSNFVSITVAENSTTCSGDCSLVGVVENAVSYSIESGVDGGKENYAVDSSTGEITVLTAPNYEDNLSPAFLVNADNAEGDLAGLISVRVTVTDVNESPVFAAGATTSGYVAEDAQDGHAVMTSDLEEATPLAITAADQDGNTLTYSIAGQDGSGVPFNISSDGKITVSGNNALDHETRGSYLVKVTATDGTSTPATHDLEIEVGNSNEAPHFVHPTLEVTIPEDTATGTEIADYEAADTDGDVLEFSLKNQDDSTHFNLGGLDGVLTIDEMLDYEDQQVHLVEINVTDPSEATAEIQLTVNVTNVNDNYPQWDSAPATNLSVAENTGRGTTLANYSATDADGQAITYSLGGSDAGSFSIDGYGNLMTLESLDADRQVPCGSDGCSVTVIATDVANANVIERGAQKAQSVNVRITVTAVEDSVSTLDVSKANPVPGTEMGNPMSALSNAKTGGDEYLWNLLDCAGMLDLVNSSDEGTYCKMWDGLSDAAKKTVSDALDMDAPAESPYDLPASYGSSPMNFVETEWANWGTVLRIEVTAESPDATCGNGNQCVVVNVNSDSADDSIKLQAYRVDTPAGSASRENHFVAALMLVELSSDATPGDAAVYSGVKGGVAALKVDEEDEVEVEFGNLRDTIDVENEAPEVSNFAPEHERAFDDPDVDYTFTITDDHSGLPEPEDLPDNDGDADYTPVVALISKSEGGAGQCSVATTPPKGADSVLSFAAHIHEDDTLYCPGRAQDGEYVASEGGFGFAPIRDDKDFDEIDNGYDVETTIVLTENDTYYVTFIVCDNAGNCAYHDPDGNDDNEELAEITVDTLDPVFVEARTGLNWDSTDNEYDDDRNYIQVIFNDLTTLNPATVEVDDFVVEGHTIESVTVYENPDDEDVNWGDSGRYAKEGHRNLRYIDRYRDLENAVFIELADELLADETPDVTIVPNGVEDGAGNEQDDGDHEADDWISPKFTVVSITSTLETAQDEVLAGDGDEITLVVTSDERLDATRPTVTVTYVNAPAGSVDTKGTMSCKVDKDTNGSRDRGEIVLTDYCQDSSAAKGGTLNNSVEKVSNTEWIVTVTEPKDTGYYSFRISGVDRSPQENPGSEGIAPDDIVTDFFDSDGDVNTDDAVFWEGDINLANPNVRVSGNVITDNEPDIEYRSPLFVEIDFTANHWSYVDCRGEDDNDDVLANCMNENSEYAEDNFDDIVITMFELDGVDMTDSVKTTDDQTFLVTLENVALGDHTARIQAMDVAGNTLEDVLEIDFEVSDRDPFERRLNPGWNLVSLPGEPADSSIGSVFGPGVEVRTVYTYDPVVPGGWMVAVRETLDSDWQGDLTEITGTRGYWVLSDAIQDWEVSIPRLAGGAAGTGTPIQPPVIALYAGWNLIPVTDISGNGSGGDTVSADVYLQNLDDGLDLARVLGFDTIRNQWETVLDPDMQMNNTLEIGSAYWIFVREAASLVPSGYVSGGGSD